MIFTLIQPTSKWVHGPHSDAILICYELPPLLPPRWFLSLTCPCWLCSSSLYTDKLDLSRTKVPVRYFGQYLTIIIGIIYEVHNKKKTEILCILYTTLCSPCSWRCRRQTFASAVPSKSQPAAQLPWVLHRGIAKSLFFFVFQQLSVSILNATTLLKLSVDQVTLYKSDYYYYYY